MKHLLAIVIAVTLLPTMDRGDDSPPNKDQQKIQGTWKLIKFETPPDKRPPDELTAKARLDFADKKLVTRIGDDVVDETTFKLDGTKSPKWFDTLVARGPNKGKTAAGIYELDGDNLKICIGPPGQKRPTAFKVTSDANAMTGVMFLKREKR